ncbi:KdsC family phosphatase [Geobacter benzoatilyticus]|jgi:3-deoxy-D-manno-octulosonate 8-phosphate phosphatase (KDO 8-P phosphatase)|uniref:HAD hydrolase family protein n=1 Tax=Geobacter benzoatilyticus TaxID=2815309 RepID=A0ABX7Q090_9BACT|nr:HAD hydrolase family protein [Geobacter benzoatilyticus]QSV44816.1 HAD hydrolase family protein [Geobacter benzoatilyticus]
MNERIRNIRLLLLDVDGVMTDGRIIFDSNGVESKFFNVKDGHGIKMVQRAGIEVGIISGRGSVVVSNRAAELGISLVYQKSLDKLTPYREILERTELTDEQVAFMGDDVIDIPVLRRVGFAAAPADAVDDVFPFVHFTSRNRGGWGAVREVCDLLLREQGKWDEITSRYFL